MELEPELKFIKLSIEKCKTEEILLFLYIRKAKLILFSIINIKHLVFWDVNRASVDSFNDIVRWLTVNSTTNGLSST
jgi:hypothetical protein